MRKERNLKVRKILAVLLSVACMIPLYVVLHEGGHALVAVMCGARITKFSILGAYMNYEGGQFSAAMFSLFHAAGMLLPLLAAILYMIAYRLRTFRHKAYYSLDRNDGIEHEALFVALSPHELYERKVTTAENKNLIS